MWSATLRERAKEGATAFVVDELVADEEEDWGPASSYSLG